MAKGLFRKIIVASLSSIVALLVVGSITSLFSEKECLVHEWDEGVITKRATCQKDGEITYTCEVCDVEKLEVLKASNLYHVWDEGEIIAEANCAIDGVTLYHCTACNLEESRIVEAFGHQLEIVDISYKAPTCTEDGEADFNCTRCGYITHEYIPALGGFCESHDGDFNCDNCNIALGPNQVSYNEVEAVVGEKVMGNWYRFYYPTGWQSPEDINGIKLSKVDSESEFVNACFLGVYDQSSSFSEYITDIGACFEDLRTNYETSQGYIDIYFGEGYIVKKDGSNAIYVDENTVITEISNVGERVAVYKLIANG